MNLRENTDGVCTSPRNGRRCTTHQCPFDALASIYADVRSQLMTSRIEGLGGSNSFSSTYFAFTHVKGRKKLELRPVLTRLDTPVRAVVLPLPPHSTAAAHMRRSTGSVLKKHFPGRGGVWLQDPVRTLLHNGPP